MRGAGRLLILAALVACALPAPATPAGDPVLDGLVEWTQVGLERLELDGAPSPHRVVTALADVVGYSRLMAADEQGTIDAITACRDEIARRVEEYPGRVVDSPGDNVLAEFPTALEAVRRSWTETCSILESSSNRCSSGSVSRTPPMTTC